MDLLYTVHRLPNNNLSKTAFGPQESTSAGAMRPLYYVQKSLLLKTQIFVINRNRYFCKELYISMKHFLLLFS